MSNFEQARDEPRRETIEEIKTRLIKQSKKNNETFDISQIKDIDEKENESLFSLIQKKFNNLKQSLLSLKNFDPFEKIKTKPDKPNNPYN